MSGLDQRHGAFDPNLGTGNWGYVMSYRHGVLFVLGAGVLWSFMGLIIRFIDGAGPFAVVFWRSVGMAPVILAIMVITSQRDILQRLKNVGWAGVIAGAGISLAYFGAIYALQTTTVANAVFLYSVAPFMAAALGFLLLKEHVGLWTLAAMSIAGAGIFVMISGESNGAGRWDGNLAAILSAFGFAVFSVALRWGHVGDMMPANLIGAAMSILIAACLAPLFGQSILASLPDIAISLAMGAVVLGGGMICYTLGTRRLRAAESTLFSGIENILAPVWVWAFLGETATSMTLIGGGMVLGAVMMNAALGAQD